MADSAAAPHPSAPPRRRRPLYGWLVAEAVSLTGTRISLIAIPLFVLEQTGSATRTGLVALAELLPLVVLKVLGGPVIDRIGPRRVAITCDVASVVVVASIPLLHDAGLLSFPGFLAVVAVAGGLRGPGDAAKQAMIPALVTSAAQPMERVTGLSSTIERTAGLVGAGIAGVLVAWLGAADALYVDAASFGVSALVLSWATRGLGAPPEPDADPLPYGRQLREGWDFLRRDRLLLGITVMVAITNFLDVAWATVLLPVWAVESGAGAARLGLAFAVMSGCSALGGLIASIYASRLPRYLTYLVAFLLCGLPRYAVFALDAPLGVVLGVIAVSGLASGFINPVLGAVIFERIPAPLVGRVSSLSTAMCFALMPLGGLLGGVLADNAGLATAMTVCGLAYLVATMAPAVDPRWREMDRPTLVEVPGPRGTSDPASRPP